MIRTCTIPLILLLLSTACTPTNPSAVNTDAVSRRIIGPASDYVETANLDPLVLQASLRETRALAWDTFAKIFADKNLDVSRPDGTSTPVALPNVFTWYSPEDVNRLMSFSFGQLTADDQIKGVPLSVEQWQASQNLFANELDSLPAPLKLKWGRFFEDQPNPGTADLIGVTGLNRTLFSPSLVQSVTRRYADLRDCFPDSQKPEAVAPHKRCWTEPLPRNSVSIKTTWLNTEAGFRTIATDAASLSELFQKPDSSWADGSVPALVPDPTKILTAQSKGKTFVLGGIHIVTKELEDWLWISAWWSDTPDQDFGEDRPERVKALGAPWNQYKICAVSGYAQDARELDEIEKTHPSLAAAYRAVLDESGASWCSNPYIEKGAHNPKTNCIGCHQFAGTDVQQAEVLSDSARFPNLGRSRQREEFPSDYIWTATQGQFSWLATIDNLLPLRQSP